ncbi:MAG: hypothetical protein AAB368_16975 [bacterium]
MPSTAFARLTLKAANFAAIASSQFTAQQQVFEHAGELWAAEITLPPMDRATAAPWFAILAALRGQSGTFFLGDPKAATPRGTVSGSLQVNGAHAAGSKTLALKTATGTLKAGDYLQIGSGASQRLYMVLADLTLAATAEIFPRLREAAAGDAAVTYTNCKGVFRLAGNERGWDVSPAGIYSLGFSAVEAI